MPAYLKPCSRRSAGNAYRHAANVASNGGGFARHAPHTASFSVPSAQRGHAHTSVGIASTHAEHTSAFFEGDRHSTHAWGSAHWSVAQSARPAPETTCLQCAAALSNFDFAAFDSMR